MRISPSVTVVAVCGPDALESPGRPAGLVARPRRL